MAIHPVSLIASFCLPLGLLLAMAGTPASAAPEDEGRSNFEVSLLVDGKKQSDTWINLSQGGTLIEIPASPVVNALAPLVSSDIIRKIEMQIGSQGTFTNKTLSRFGISMSINGSKKEVSLSLAKSAPKAKRPDPDSLAPPVTTMDSGPWASAPMPALPGRMKDSLDTVFTPNGKPGARDTARAASRAAAPPATARPATSDADWEAAGKASEPSGTAAAAKPDQQIGRAHV